MTAGFLSRRVLVATLWLAAGPAALAHPKDRPANDDFARPTLMRGTRWSTTGTNRGATLEAGEPNHDGATPGASVWWQWTAPRTGMVRLSTQGSDFDTVLGVYAGPSVAGLTRVVSNDDDHGRQSLVRFFAKAGTRYSIAVSGDNAWTGRVVLSLDRIDTPLARRPGPWREGLLSVQK